MPRGKAARWRGACCSVHNCPPRLVISIQPTRCRPHRSGSQTTGEPVFKPENDPIVMTLDRALRARDVINGVDAALSRVTAALDSGSALMAWEVLPLDLFPGLPPEIQSCWIFVIRPGQATGAERHPNSHQRSLSLQGSGRFELRQGDRWEPHDLEAAAAAFEQRWVTIPPNTWHRLFSRTLPWGMISFHTVPSDQLVEERPTSELELDTGPTSRRLYQTL